MSRRDALLSLLPVLIGCSSAVPPASLTPPPSGPRPLFVPRLDSLLPRARMRLMVEARPREIAQVPWLIPPIGRLADEDRLSAFARDTGFDLRQIPDAIVASYAGDGGDETIYLVHHNSDAAIIQRLFERRLSGSVRRGVERDDVVFIAGTLGATSAAMLLIGRSVAGFEFGSRSRRGPLRIAVLYAMGALRKSPTVFAEEPFVDYRRASVRRPCVPSRSGRLRANLEGSVGAPRGCHGCCADDTPLRTRGIALYCDRCWRFSERAGRGIQPTAARLAQACKQSVGARPPPT